MMKNISNELIFQYSTLLEKKPSMLILISLSRNHFEIRTIFFKRTIENRKFHQSVRRNPALPRYVTHSTPAVYPHLDGFTGKLNFVIKVDSTNLESQNQAKNISVILLRSPIKIWGKSVTGFMIYDRIHKQTEITTL